MHKLNLGCGRHRLPGWQHVDQTDYGDNIVFNLDHLTGSRRKLPFDDNSCDEFILSHVIEHISDTLGLMQELHRVAAPGAVCHIAVPFAFSEASIEDQTHVRQFTFNSFCFFSQPVYCNADYGYRGDWHCPKVIVKAMPEVARQPSSERVAYCKRHRNAAIEILADLVAVKPIRAQAAELVTVPEIIFDYIK